jgi:hypothetical protein
MWVPVRFHSSVSCWGCQDKNTARASLAGTGATTRISPAPYHGAMRPQPHQGPRTCTAPQTQPGHTSRHTPSCAWRTAPQRGPRCGPRPHAGPAALGVRLQGFECQATGGTPAAAAPAPASPVVPVTQRQKAARPPAARGRAPNPPRSTAPFSPSAISVSVCCSSLRGDPRADRDKTCGSQSRAPRQTRPAHCAAVLPAPHLAHGIGESEHRWRCWLVRLSPRY